MSAQAYDKNGRMLASELIVQVLSPGYISPRQYMIYCANVVNGKRCGGKMHSEDSALEFLSCNACGVILGFRLEEGEMH